MTLGIDRIDSLNEQAWELMLNSPEDALILSQQALDAARHESYTSGEASALLNRGWCEAYLSRNEAAINLINQAAERFAAIDSHEGLMKAYNALGVIYTEMSRYEPAMDYYSKSLEIARRHGDIYRESAALCNIAEVCLEFGENKEALDCSLRAYEIAGAEQAPEMMVNVLNNIGVAFTKLGNLPLAREFTEQGLGQALSTQSPYLEAICRQNLGRIAQAQAMFDLAETEYTKALELNDKLKNLKQRAAILLDMGSLRLAKGDRDGTLANYQEALDIAEAIESRPIAYAAHEKLAEVHEELGNYKAALFYHRSFARYQHEIMSEDAGRKLKSVTAQYEIEKSRQEAEIYRLRNIELKEKTEALERANSRLLAISEIGRRITASLDLDTIIKTLHDTLKGIIPFDVYSLALYDASDESIDYYAYFIEGERIHRERKRAPIAGSFAELCLRQQKRIFVADQASQSACDLAVLPLYSGRQPRSFIVHPLVIDDQSIGLITVQSFEAGGLTEHHAELLASLAPYASIAVENGIIHDRLLAVNRSISGQKKALEQATVDIIHMANHDSLTGLPNRRLLFELLQKTFDIAARSGTRVGIIYIDLDDFKPVNDLYGHATGDKALVAVAERLQALLRASDTVARVGGDEFVVVLSNIHDRDDIQFAAEKILEEYNIPFSMEGHEFRIGFSMGIAIYPDDGTSIEALLNAADAAMYNIKNSRKNSYAFTGGPVRP